MAKIRELTCIVCPRGCQLKVTLTDDGSVSEVYGNGCRRGFTYANDECTNPKRTVTSTVRLKDGRVLPVKTKDTVPKGKVFEVMAHINKTIGDTDLKIGDTVIENVADTGVAVVACQNA